jgi:hypothetical protein
MIELEQDIGLPDGETVAVIVQRVSSSGEGIRASAGGWADAGEDLDTWLDEMCRSRQQDRPEPSR